MICPRCGRVNLEAARSVNASSSATPTRTFRTGTRRHPEDVNRNSWERGIARDEYGLPYLDEHLQPVGVKRFAERRNSGDWDHPGRRVSSAPEIGKTS